MEKEQDIYRLCGEKLNKKEGDSLYYCLKCSEKIKNEGGK